MHWVVVAPFNIADEEQGWLTPAVPGDGHTFQLVGRPRALASRLGGSNLDAMGWWHTLRYARRALRRRERWGGGVITVFPQLAVTAGLRGRLCPDDPPIVAWCFNMGRLYHGLRLTAARFALQRVRRFIVHARAEIAAYSRWLDLPPDRFEFVHLQRNVRTIPVDEDRREPFVLAMGSARRDYRTFLAAVGLLRIPTVLVAAPHALAGLSIPSNVTVRCGLAYDECRVLAQRARVSVIPIANDHTASGQVTLVDAMSLGRPVVATRCVGTEDYVQPGETGVLVEPNSVEDLTVAIDRLWQDEPLRLRLGVAARSFAVRHCSDEAAGRSLKRVLDSVAGHDGGGNRPLFPRLPATVTRRAA